jgi:hypothetical protein
MRLLLQSCVDVIAQSQRQARSGRDHTGQPHDGHDANENIHDLGRRGAGTHRGVGLSTVGPDLCHLVRTVGAEPGERLECFVGDGVGCGDGLVAGLDGDGAART